MNTYTVTVTSKNQITLPVDIVRNMRLGKGRRLRVVDHGTRIDILPEPSLKDELRSLHEKIAQQRGNRPAPTEDELRSFIQQGKARRAV